MYTQNERKHKLHGTNCQHIHEIKSQSIYLYYVHFVAVSFCTFVYSCVARIDRSKCCFLRNMEKSVFILITACIGKKDRKWELPQAELYLRRCETSNCPKQRLLCSLVSDWPKTHGSAHFFGWLGIDWCWNNNTQKRKIQKFLLWCKMIRTFISFEVSLIWCYDSIRSVTDAMWYILHQWR